jgi:hypothetical protein
MNPRANPLKHHKSCRIARNPRNCDPACLCVRQSRPCRRGLSSRPRRSEPEAAPGGTSCSHGQTRRLLSTASCPPSCTEMTEYINHMLAHCGQDDAAGHIVVWIGVGATKISSHLPSTKVRNSENIVRKKDFRKPFRIFKTQNVRRQRKE